MELLVLGLVASIGFASYALWSRGRVADRPIPPRALPPAERTLTTLQVGDIVQHLGADWLVEGVLTLSDDGQGTRLYRLTDGSVERYLYATPSEPDPALLAPAPELALDGAPATLLHADRSFALQFRATVSVLRAGTVGERRAGDRVALASYTSGSARLLLLAWTDHADAFLGERISAHLLELLPGR